jgi:hypothetical protein
MILRAISLEKLPIIQSLREFTLFHELLQEFTFFHELLQEFTLFHELLQEL